MFWIDNKNVRCERKEMRTSWESYIVELMYIVFNAILTWPIIETLDKNTLVLDIICLRQEVIKVNQDSTIFRPHFGRTGRIPVLVKYNMSLFYFIFVVYSLIYFKTITIVVNCVLRMNICDGMGYLYYSHAEIEHNLSGCQQPLIQ